MHKTNYMRIQKDTQSKRDQTMMQVNQRWWEDLISIPSIIYPIKKVRNLADGMANRWVKKDQMKLPKNSHPFKFGREDQPSIGFNPTVSIHSNKQTYQIRRLNFFLFFSNFNSKYERVMPQAPTNLSNLDNN